MTLEDLQQLAALLQSLAVTTAVIAGGIWALFRFRALHELDRARAELSRLKHELTRRPSVTIDLDFQTPEPIPGLGKCLIVSALLRNVGTQVAILDWSQGYIDYARVKSFAADRPEFEEWRSIIYVSSDELISSSIDPGDSDRMPFVLPIDTPGLYLVDFNVCGSKDDVSMSEAEHRTAGHTIGTISYSAAAFVFVGSER